MKTLLFLSLLVFATTVDAQTNPVVELGCIQNAAVARKWAEQLRPRYSQEFVAPRLLAPYEGGDVSDPNFISTIKGIELVWGVPYKSPEEVEKEFYGWCVKAFSPQASQ